jgi:hypothetical protein
MDGISMERLMDERQGLLALGDIAAEGATRLTQRDRDALLKLARERADVAKVTARRRTADMLAQFELEMQQHYERQDNEVFSRVTDVLAVDVQKAREEINKECERLHIPVKFRPQIRVAWDPGGACGVERQMLLELAKKQAAAQEMRAFEAIEQATVEAKTAIVAASFDPGVAMQALNAMPSVQTLIPPMSFSHIEQLFKRDPQRIIDEYNRERSYVRIDSSDVYSLASPTTPAETEERSTSSSDPSPWAGPNDIDESSAPLQKKAAGSEIHSPAVSFFNGEPTLLRYPATST